MTSRRPPFSSAARNWLARSAVSRDRSVSRYEASTRPASMREKSSSELASLSRRSWLRWTISSGEPLRARPADASASSVGPIISASGVRNSWLTLEKKTVLARSISASASVRSCASLRARALRMAVTTCAAASSKKVR